MTATENDPLLQTTDGWNGRCTNASNDVPNEVEKGSGSTRLLAVAVVCLLVGIVFGVTTTLLVGKSHTPKAAPVQKIKRDSKYAATQFISFSINTLGGIAKHGECEGRTVDPEDGLCYLGNKDDLEDDLNHRFDLLAEVLLTLKEDHLNEMPEIDHSPSVLKIFMLPEFFLRGPNGAYNTKQLGEDGLLFGLADKIHQIVDREEFEDFLFVFGTVIATESPNDPSLPWEQEPGQNIQKGDILYFNFAPVYRGGRHDHLESYLVPKKYISGADFLNRKNGLPDPRQYHLSEYDSSLEIDEEVLHFLINQRNITIVEDNVLDIDGIRIGIEICLDHRLGALWNQLQKTGEDLVDVQLITSAGMAIERGPTPLRPGGVISDGWRSK